MATPPFRVVPGASQFVSEPPPALFGNPPNSINASWSNANWLRSRFHFNFAEYSRGRPRFGVLRVRMLAGVLVGCRRWLTCDR